VAPAPPRPEALGWSGPPKTDDPEIGKRFVGLVVDLTLMIPGCVLMVVSVLSQPHETEVGVSSIQVTSSGSPSALFWLGWILALVLHVANRVVLQGITGRSLGKRLVGTRLVRVDNTEAVPGVGRAAVRTLIEMLGWIDLIVALVSQRHQRIGDMAMKTIVIRDARGS